VSLFSLAGSCGQCQPRHLPRATASPGAGGCAEGHGIAKGARTGRGSPVPRVRLLERAARPVTAAALRVWRRGRERTGVRSTAHDHPCAVHGAVLPREDGGKPPRRQLRTSGAAPGEGRQGRERQGRERQGRDASGGTPGEGSGREGIDVAMDHHRAECGSYPTNRDVYGSLTEVSQLTGALTRRLHRLHRPGAAGTVNLGATAPDGST